MSSIIDLAASSSSSSSSRSGLSITNPSPVPLDSVAVLSCSAYADSVTWSFSGGNFTEKREGSSGLGYQVSTLTIQAVAHNNGTPATCNAFTLLNQAVKHLEANATLIIYGKCRINDIKTELQPNFYVRRSTIQRNWSQLS